MKKLIIALGLLLQAPTVFAASCKDGKRPEISIKEKTPVRRGPGLNYPVSAFLEKTRCLKLGEVSVDGSWVRVEDGDLFGWVPVSSVSKESLKKVQSFQPTAGPIGSGQERGVVKTTESVPLRKLPTDKEGRKTLPAGASLVALSVSEDGKWVEVRDDRGEVGWVPATAIQDPGGLLESLPKLGTGLETGMTKPPNKKGDKTGDKSPEKQPDASPPPKTDPEDSVDVKGKPDEVENPESKEPPVLAETGEVESSGSLRIEATAMALALLPTHELDSNGVGATRRYSIGATAAGVHVGVKVRPLGPVQARLGYSVAVLSGIAPANAPAATVGGHEHDAQLMVGYPIDLGALWITPEVGYAFGLYSVDFVVPGVENGTLFSHQTHSGAVAVNLGGALTEDLGWMAAGGVELGMRSTSPISLGSAGLGFGFRAQVGTSYEISEELSAVLQGEFRQVSVSFTGPTPIDATISRATLTDRAIGIFGGMSLSI